MKKNAKARNKKQEQLLTSIDNINHGSLLGFTLLLVLHLTTFLLVRGTALSEDRTITLLGHVLPLTSFTGIFSSLGNICIIFMAFYYGKKGYITAMIILCIQIPLVLIGFLYQHSLASLPGVFANMLAAVAITVIYHNNQKLGRYQNKLRDQAVTDMLTGLPNRFACSELVKDLVQRNEPFALVSIDLNGFKSINNTLGFASGNKVLQDIASRWQRIASSRVQDVIFRLSGDEFALILRHVRSVEEAAGIVGQYESVLKKRLTVDDCDFYMSAGFGFALFPDDAGTADTICSAADAAMNEVKRLNSSEHILHFTAECFKLERNMELEHKIRTALESDAIYFHLQPQYDMQKKLRGFEALARMKDADGKFISPGEFIPVAEKVGLIDKVDGAVFRKSAAFFGKLLRESGADITLSINVSVRHLMKNDFLDEIRSLLETSQIPPGQLEIEITESIMIDSAEKALQCINEIKAMGIQLALDDFGTGYSSLSYLNSFPADLLKIDKSFIDRMNSNDSSKQYVAAIISIGHIMGFHVISEGVEEEAQLETLRSIGCDYIQGYLWGRPMPPEEAEKLVLGSA